MGSCGNFEQRLETRSGARRAVLLWSRISIRAPAAWQLRLNRQRTPVIAFPGPEDDGAIGCALEIEFGIDANFLPQPDLPDSPRMIESNIKSLLKLVHDLDDALPVETRRLWSESGENFAEKLHQALTAVADVRLACARRGISGTLLEQILHRFSQHFRHERLLQKCNLPLQRRWKVLDEERRSAADQNPKVGPDLEHARQKRVAGHVRHAEIGDHHLVTIRRGFKIAQRIEGLQMRLHFESQPLKILLDQLQQWRLIFHQQNLDLSCTHPLWSRCPSMIGSMRFHTEYLKFQTKQHRQYINITTEVDAALKKSGIREGMILVSAMHITAGVWVNDAEDGLLADIDEWLEKLAPFRENYRHHRTGETNGDSHLKSLLVHHQVIVPVTDGKLDFGPWQQVYYAEFDGQRPKRVIIKVMGE